MTKVWLSRSWRPTKSNPKRKCWLARWIGSDGEHHGAVLGDCAKMDKTEAKRQAEEKQAKMNLGLAPVTPPKRSGLEAFLRRDREACVKQRPRTLDEMKCAAAHAVAALGADADVTRLDEADVGRLVKHLKGKALTDATIVKVVRHVQAAFSRGVRRREVVRNPFKGFEDLPKVMKRGVSYYSPREVEALIESAPSAWWATFIRLAGTSGLREGELLNLTWDDVDLDRGTVTVAPKAGGTFAAGDREYPILPWVAKDHDTRSVPIPPSTVAALRGFQEFQEPPRSPYVFLSLERLSGLARYREAKGGRLPDKLVNNLLREFRVIQAAAAAAMSEGARSAWPRRPGRSPETREPYRWRRRTIHDLRKSYATRMASHVAPHELQRLLGHSEVGTTMSYYVGDSDTSARVRAAFDPVGS